MSFINQVPYRTLRNILELKGLGHEMNNFLKVWKIISVLSVHAPFFLFPFWNINIKILRDFMKTNQRTYMKYRTE